MKIIITDEILDKAELSLEELLYLILLDLGASNEIKNILEEKEWLHNGHLTEASKQRLADILNNTVEESPTEYRINTLAERLMEIFPKGKKPGTPYYWKCNKNEIKSKLKKFFVYFGNTYSDSQILSAARSYVKSFNGDYTFMRLLKYFIWKNDASIKGEKVSVELVSDLASYIENSEQDNTEQTNIGNWHDDLI